MRKNAFADASPESVSITPRMLNEIQARAYTGLGRSSIRKLGAELGAIKRFGRRIMYDRTIIDQYFDAQ